MEEAGLSAEVGEEITHFMNADTNGRDLTFHTITYRLHVLDDSSDVRLSPEEHDHHRWVTTTEAEKMPLVWHVAETLSALATR